MIKNKESAEHYIWGAGCDGWKLVNDPRLSIIHEKMPPSTCESRHYHELARQFFFILSGVVELEVDGVIYTLSQQEGMEVHAGAPHQIFNRTEEDVESLVISSPRTAGDRVELT
ncbi:cupin domain-containing protein [Paenibacillus gallinarum]|uniref:Cupin domain-containing protein n=1 Tax=Paenibacillus gallinarum TaxID=2762232 RepID=A0ABR8STE5_9BACL|nr:cupin domain-containing protein [Paenibacillus gallinarum]MBD7966767.1 cupin domain-containing protein [Paenibacillus gallinarum]